MLSYEAKFSDTLKVVNHYTGTTKPGVLNAGGKEPQRLSREWSLGPTLLHMEWARFSGELCNLMKKKKISKEWQVWNFLILKSDKTSNALK